MEICIPGRNLQAFGCMDGTDIEIERPIESAQDFYNYEQFFSITVQTVFDITGRFMDIENRWSGSHGRRIT